MTDSASRSNRRCARRHPKRLSEVYRTAFVTGASTGLGAAFAQMLLDEGLRVFGTARDISRLESLTAANRSFTPVVLDLADGAAAERVFSEASESAGGFDIVINNAGYSVFGDFAQTDFAYWQAQIEVMLVNTARLAHAALSTWQKAGDGERPKALVNVSSLAAEFPLPFQSGYNVVKAGLSALNESLIVETAGTSVRVIDLRPGDYRTDFGSSVMRPNHCSDAASTQAVWERFAAMMRSGPPPAHAAQCLRRALLRRHSGTLRCGRFFQVVLAPFLVRFASLGLKRRVQALYFGL
ncbi:hypothetical protein AXK12_03405 [Cephaloticoccus capnophilus]|uniref:Short-chain dehydrogenase n=1 Tax=Cephaloticoccus capnophilus TaxID=1548208 RepID=A0A139SP15_9BACT|nr:SDR family NAD(P)-dependent oxidoreductase [Cephaloticoccus capnophilus]KXU36345.1 hypothetical protein AXK12_03405 [Cephaloticoccus capnophilus]